MITSDFNRSTDLKTQRNSIVDLMRILACLMVMFHHAGQQIAPANAGGYLVQAILIAGNCGVSIFFVLSGFLLAEPFWRAYLADEGMPSLKVFWIRRFARIAPAFWINLTFCFILSLFLFPSAPLIVVRYLAGLFFVAGFSYQTFFPVELNGPLWSIGFEVISYGLLALFSWLWFKKAKKRSAPRAFFFWGLVLLLALAFHCALLAFGQTDASHKGWQFGLSGGAKEWWPYYNPVGFFAVFAIGILGAGVSVMLHRSADTSKPFSVALGKTLFWLGVIVFVLSLFFYMFTNPYGYGLSFPRMPYVFPVMPIAVVLILAFGRYSPIASRVSSLPAFAFLANISYSLYLWHDFFMTMAFSYLGFPKTGNLQLWGGEIVVIFAASFLIAWASWHFLESRLVNWSHALTKKK